MSVVGEIGSKIPETQNKNESSCVEVDLFLDLIFDGFDTSGAQKNIYEKYRKGPNNVSILGNDNFRLNLLLGSIDNPDKLKLSKENEESPTSIHQKIIIKITPGKKGRHYINQIERSIEAIKRFVEKYLSNNEVESINVHVTILCYNQGEIVANIASALGFDKEDEDISAELSKIFDFRHHFGNYKIKSRDVVSISIIDVISPTTEIVKSVSALTGRFLFRTAVCIKDLLWNNPIVKFLTGRSNIFSVENSDMNFPSEEKITVLDAAIMCQHTYNSEAPVNKSVFSMVGALMGNECNIATQDQVSISVDRAIEDNIIEYNKRMKLNGKQGLEVNDGHISTHHNWIPVNIDGDYVYDPENIMSASKVSLVSNFSGFFSKIYVKKNNDGTIDYAYCTAGTEPSSANDWIFANFLQGLTGLSLQHTQSVRNAKKLDKFCRMEPRKRRLFFVGHSLGGGLASNNAIVTSDKHAITFNAAGLNMLRIGATLFINNPKAYFQHDERVSRVHPFIIDGEAVQFLRFIGQPAMNASKGQRFYNNEAIAMNPNETTIFESKDIEIINSEPITKLGHLNAVTKHTVENFLRLKDLEALEIIK